jgi:hypothetical protein
VEKAEWSQRNFMFHIKAQPWDDTRYSFLSRAQQGLDTLMLLFCCTEFLLFLLLDKDDYTYIFSSGMMSVSLFTLLLITYILERLLFACYRLFQHGMDWEIEDVGDALIVLFLGPYYHLRMSFPYETRSSLHQRAKLELFGFMVNLIKLSLLLYLAIRNGTRRIERQMVIVFTCSLLELLCTTRNVIAMLRSKIPKHASEAFVAMQEKESVESSAVQVQEPFFVVVVKKPSNT